ncbi:uncharacterized protein K02A2.6-like [Athalia rosae]|uniref:uncharacterized protein K02A2.6-like n=1 Tax=Athalia rosae TaxID=37344 RepID=UPI002033E7B6|nr:uncharacterized protein K02A2.6-like [Athalia rosae]
MEPESKVLVELFDPASMPWKRWLQRFDGAMTIHKITGEDKVPYILHHLGVANYAKLCDFCDDVDLYKLKYTDLIAYLASLFEDKVVEIAEAYKFHCRKQGQGESVKDYVTALKKLSQTCGFGSFLQTAIRNQFVYGLNNPAIRQRLLETETLTLEKALNVASAMELSKKENEGLSGYDESIQFVATSGRRRGSQFNDRDKSRNSNFRRGGKQFGGKKGNESFCFRCGSPDHIANKCSLDKNVKCRACGVLGHIQKVCFKTKSPHVGLLDSEYNNKQSGSESDESEPLNVIEVFGIEHPEMRDKITVKLNVNGHDVMFDHDTGAGFTLMNVDQAKAIFKHGVIYATKLTAISYCHTPIQVQGFMIVKVKYRDSIYKLNLYVTNLVRPPLLGREWMRIMRMFPFDGTNEVCNSVMEKESNIDKKTEIEKLFQKYPNLLKEDMSPIHEFKATLVLKENATPVFIKARRVPFRLIPLVETELDNLEKKDIIEKVNTSKFATPIVPVLKKNNTVRICGDFSITINPQLIVDEYHLPTTDELLADMAGCKIFAKVDLSQAYLQLCLDEKSSEIVVLNTHRGLYKCKRLWYGLAPAVAIWQRFMESILAGIKGVSVFIDDIKMGARNWAQVDKEAYAIVWAVKRLYQYVYGRKFELITDNRAIQQIFSPDKSLPVFSAMRMQHYAIFLRGFTYTIRFKKSEHNANADCLSRLPVPGSVESVDALSVFYINLVSTIPVTFEEIKKEIDSKQDADICKVINLIKQGKKLESKDTWNCNPLEFNLEFGILLRGHQVVIPRKLRKSMLDQLHVGHFGIVKMKNLARGYCWWPNISLDIEHKARNCYECNLHSRNPPANKLHIWEPASVPFERVHCDFAGPFLGKMFFLYVDAFSKWPEVHVVKNIKTETIILKCREIFAIFGLPKNIVSDNGPTFKATEFHEFLHSHGILHRFSAPYNPQTNGQVEIYVNTIKQSLKKMCEKVSDVQEALLQVLTQYRITPQVTTGKAPSELLFGTKPRCTLDLLKPVQIKQTIVEHNNQIPVRKFKLNDRVACRNYANTQKWFFGRILKILGKCHYLIKLDDTRIWKRHVNQLRKIGEGIENRSTPDYDYYVPPEEQMVFYETVQNDDVSNAEIANESANASAGELDETPPVGPSVTEIDNPVVERPILIPRRKRKRQPKFPGKYDEFICDIPPKRSKSQ